MFTVRSAKSADISVIHSLLCGIATLHKSNRSDYFYGFDSKYSEEQLALLLNTDDKAVFVAEEKGVVLGYVICELRNNKKKIVYVDDLCVDESHRHEGIATALLKKAEQYGKDNSCLALELNVWEFNRNAVEFYEKYGLKTQKRQMEKEL